MAKQSEHDGRTVHNVGSTQWGERKQASWAFPRAARHPTRKTKGVQYFGVALDVRALVMPIPYK
jgi:hypothetical protein